MNPGGGFVRVKPAGRKKAKGENDQGVSTIEVHYRHYENRMMKHI
jgi:hypothetical protein